MPRDERDCREPGTTATQAFFGPRAAGWEQRFPDDAPRYARAVAELAPISGGAVLDAACGTGRAIPPLRAAVGSAGTVIAIDLTPEMLTEAVRHGRERDAHLVLADVARLPLADGSLDAVFAAGLIPHLSDPVSGLRELARVCRQGARLALFHPIGRHQIRAAHPGRARECRLAAGARRRRRRPLPGPRGSRLIQRRATGHGFASASPNRGTDDTCQPPRSASLETWTTEGS
jgi:SAM-dependent methyltransferase